MGLIYQATINNKSYIGYTKKSLDKRIYHHLDESINHRDNSYFHKAIRKYGKDNIKWEIIEDNIIDFNRLLIREKYWIRKLKTSVPFGYNLTMGGDGGDTLSNHPDLEKIRKKLCKAQRKNIKENPDRIRKQAESLRGHKQSEETKRRRSESMKHSLRAIKQRYKLHQSRKKGK